MLMLIAVNVEIKPNMLYVVVLSVVMVSVMAPKRGLLIDVI